MLLQLFQHFVVLLFLLLISYASGQGLLTRLPPEEVESLRAIGTKLGKTDWNFAVDPCSRSPEWVDLTKGKENAVTCNCDFANGTVCHVTSIILKAQNLTGIVPPELTTLPYLQEIDLTRNFLSGSIPPEWGTMQLVNVSLIGNRITGPIPKELGNISTLANLTLEYNQLSGPIPPELGGLSRIEKLVIMSNNLSGPLPLELGKLTALKDFRISDNNFTGKIPDFISNWKQLDKLAIQGSGLSGPIPRAIGSLTSLTDLRISDLIADEAEFPPLSNITKFKTLILRNCNITGQLPEYLGDMTSLKVLDLSFNKLTGPIPPSFRQLSDVDRMYLTGNSLSGPLPNWMLSEGQNIDLSYNNLTPDQSSPNCQPRDVNLFASSKGNTTGIVSCLRNQACDRSYYELHINCGGKSLVDDEQNSYVSDTESASPSRFRLMGTNWGYSSTGHFMDDDRSTDSYIWSTTSRISGPNAELYKDARRSPLSLTYYSFCLINGSYTVDLHFAEIMFTNDSTYSSLGRRVFDVYIQDKLVLKDFNIAKEAGGVNIGIKRNFTVSVDDGTMDIRFFWAGKGTIGIPNRGVYGPLISAISIKSNSKPPSENGKGISTGAIVGIVIAGLFAVFFILAILWWKGCRGRKHTMADDLKGIDLHTGIFSLRQIKTATNDFDPANKIGEGGFGPVYKGHLSDGTIIAVKQLSAKSKQGNREFVNEIGMISALQHPHLVKLHGCCIEGNQLLLIYEYLENNSLARALFGHQEQQLHLDWPTRHKISIGIARGLAYLHEESRLKIVHRDIKATNVLLDKDLVPKISDFGLAKLDEEDNTHISTRVAGTFGYMAPEYAMRGHLTDKADVYSFGVVLLEIVCGRSNTSIKPKEEPFYLLDWANSLKEKGNLLELVDPRLGSNYNKKEVITTINLGLNCTSVVAADRPNMSTVVSILEGKGHTFEYVPGKDVSNGKDVSSTNGGFQEEQSVRTDVAWTGSSASTGDLYPIIMNTDYWQKRDP